MSFGNDNNIFRALQQFIDSGNVGFIQKPYNIKSLGEELYKILSISKE